MNQPSDSGTKRAAFLVESKGHLAALETDLPDRLEGYQFANPTSFQAGTLRELLRHRMRDLAHAAIPLLEEKRVVPGAILVRAAAETAALQHGLHHEVAAFAQSHDDQRFRDFLGTALVGSRNPEHPIQAKNILGYVQKLAKDFPAFQKSYDALSEFAHPNWSGVLGAYGSIDYTDWSVTMGSRNNTAGLNAAALSLAIFLSTFAYYYDSLADSLKGLDDYYIKRFGPAGEA